jgi:small subunit ribosomal protein S13
MSTIRIAGITLPPEKQILISLTYIFGIGTKRSRAILGECGISSDIRTKDLTEPQAQKIRSHLEKEGIAVEGELRREIVSHIRRLKEIGSYRGSRHAKKLPVRGQRTRTNSRTIRGNIRRTMGSGKKPPAQKT